MFYLKADDVVKNFTTAKECRKFSSQRRGEMKIGNHCWLGTNSMIMPEVQIGNFCVVARDNFVNQSFES